MSKCNLLIPKYTLLLYYVFTIPTLCNATNADGTVQDRITPLEQRVTKLEQDVNKLNNSQHDTNQRIQSIQTEQENEKKIIQNIQTINQDIQNKNQNITQEIQNIHKSITELSDKINSLDSNHKENIKDINDKLKKLSDSIEEIDIKKYNDDIEKIYEKNSQLGKYVEDHSEALKQLLKEINEMKELFCNNVLDGKCSLDDFSKLVKNANKNWKKGNINDLINNLPKKDETTTTDSTDDQTNKTTTVPQTVMNNELIELLKQIQSSNQLNPSLDEMMKIIQQHINNQNTKQMDLYNQLSQYINQINQPSNINANLIRKYLEQRKKLNPQQFQEWLDQQKLDDPQNYNKLLIFHNKINNPQLFNDPNYQNWLVQQGFGSISYNPQIFPLGILPGSRPNNIRQHSNNNDSQQDVMYTSIGNTTTQNNTKSIIKVGPINEDPNSNNTGQNYNNNGDSQYNGGYGSNGQHYYSPGYGYYPMWPYNKNDLSYYYAGDGYYDDNNIDYDDNNIDPNNPNVNPSNIRPGNVYPGRKRRITSIDNNREGDYVVLTDCNGQKRTLSQNEVMNLIKQGTIQYKCS